MFNIRFCARFLAVIFLCIGFSSCDTGKNGVDVPENHEPILQEEVSPKQSSAAPTEIFTPNDSNYVKKTWVLSGKITLIQKQIFVNILLTDAML